MTTETDGHETTPEGVRVYRGRKLEDILPQIREELGPDAIILREREGLVGGFGGFFAQRFIEVEARRGGPSIDVYDEDGEDEIVLPSPAIEDLPATPEASGEEPRPAMLPIDPLAELDAREPEAFEPEPPPSDTDAFMARLREAAAAWTEDDTPRAELTTGAAVVEDEVIDAEVEEAPEVPQPEPTPQPVKPKVARKPRAKAAPKAKPEPKPAAKAKTTPKPQPKPKPKPATKARATARPKTAPRPKAAPPPPEPVAEKPAVLAPDPEPAITAPAPAPRPAPRPAPEPVAPAPAPRRAGFLARLLGRRAPEPVVLAEPQAIPGRALDATSAAAIVGDLTTRGGSQLWASQLVSAAGAHGYPLSRGGGLRASTQTELARRLQPAPSLPSGGAAIAFVGAGGAGKSRCTAALACAYRHGSTLSVTVVALDTADHGAELRALLADDGVPVFAESGAAAIERVNAARSGGLVIVDTPATTPTDPSAIAALGASLAPLGLDAIYVTLPATLGAQAARRALASFGSVRPTAVAITHADETDQLGVAVEIAATHRIPLAYVHAGTDLDRSLSAVDPVALARHLLP